MTLPTSYALSGNDAHILQGLYCDTFTFFRKKFENICHDCTKTCVPSTGRYYLIPILPIYSNTEKVLHESEILNDFRTSVITLSGFDSPPSVNASASNGAKGRAEWNAETKTLTLTVISNGETRITVEQ